MLFMIKGTDGPDTAATRRAHLQEHLDYVEANMAPVRVAGPLFEEGRGIVGSLYILEVEDEAAVRHFMKNDPYFDKNIWAELTITPFRSVAGSWVGGKTW